MDTRESNELVKALESILEDVTDKNKIGVAIERYLYNENDKAIAVPVMLWNIIVYLSKEMEGQLKLDYQTDVYDCKWKCLLRCGSNRCWTEEELIFVKTDDMYIDITTEPLKSIKCGGEERGGPDCQFCAFFLRGCLYKYETQCQCYVPEEFYRWGMFVFFLYSFNAFFSCFKYCIEYGNHSLNLAFRNVLKLTIGLQGLSDKKFKEVLKAEYTEAEYLEAINFVKFVIRGCPAMGEMRYALINSRVTHFIESMKRDKKSLINLLKDNECRAKEILGENLRGEMLHMLEINWLGE